MKQGVWRCGKTLPDMEKMWWIPFALLWIVLQVYFLRLELIGGDEVYFGSVLQSYTMAEFLRYHYLTWSSRTFVEFVEVLLCTVPRMVWRLLTPLLITGSSIFLSDVLDVRKDPAANSFLSGLILLYTWTNLSTAGWLSTTLVFLYPAAAMTAALWLLMRYVRTGQKKGALAASLPLVLYSCNNEQCMILFGFLLAGIVVYLIVNKVPVVAFVYVQAGAFVFDLLWTLFCPGQSARNINEIVSHYKDFPMVTTLDKFENGLSAALYYLLYYKNYIVMFLALSLLVCVCVYYKNWFYRMIALFPVVFIFVLGFKGDYFIPRLSLLKKLNPVVDIRGYIHLGNSNSPAAYLVILLVCIVLCALMLSVYLSFGHTGKGYLALLTFVSGFACVGAMGFTPALGVSGLRTAFLCEMSFLAVAVLAFRQIKLKCAVAAYVVYLPFVLCALNRAAEMIGIW